MKANRNRCSDGISLREMRLKPKPPNALHFTARNAIKPEIGYCVLPYSDQPQTLDATLFLDYTSILAYLNLFRQSG
ncbi:hypothetical protein CXF70_08405 [Planomicrobium sp. MB-3u-38]|nr:hypothetical protein CXF70_08405 [Planomicrobium sp. MB-3u-38]